MRPFLPIRMLQAAHDAADENHRKTGKEPPNAAVTVLIFLLIFAVSSLAQAILCAPFRLAFLLSDEAVTSLLNSSDLSFIEIMETLSKLSTTDPDWFIAIQLFATSATIAACFVYCRLIEKRSWLSLGLIRKGAIAEYTAGLGMGLVMFGLAIAFCLVTGQLSLAMNPAPSLGMILLYFLGFLVQGMSEEILCRSYLMVSIQRSSPLWAAVLTNALLFTLLHLGNPGMTPLALLNLTLFGIFASLYTLRRGSIWGIAALHSVWNFAQGSIFGISVSGLSGAPSLLTATTSEGGALIHGGDFGTEGGLAVTLVLTLGCVILMLVKTKKSEIVEISPVV